MEEADKG